MSVVVEPTSKRIAGPVGTKRPANVASANQLADAAGKGSSNVSAGVANWPSVRQMDTGVAPANSVTARTMCRTPSRGRRSSRTVRRSS